MGRIFKKLYEKKKFEKIDIKLLEPNDIIRIFDDGKRVGEDCWLVLSYPRKDFLDIYTIDVDQYNINDQKGD